MTSNENQLKLGGTNRAEMKAAAELLRENLPGLIYPNEAECLVVQWKGDNYDQEGGSTEAIEVFKEK